MKSQLLKILSIIAMAANIQSCKIQADFSGEVEAPEISDEGGDLWLQGVQGQSSNPIQSIHYLSTQGMARPMDSSIAAPDANTEVSVSLSSPREDLVTPTPEYDELTLSISGRSVRASFRNSYCQVGAEMDREDLIGLVQAVREARKQRINQGGDQHMIVDAAEKTLTVERRRGPVLVYHLNQYYGISPTLPYPINSVQDIAPVAVASSELNPEAGAALTLPRTRHFAVEDSSEILEEVAYLVKEITKREKCSRPEPQPVSETAAVQFLMTKQNADQTSFQHVNIEVRILGDGQVSIFGKVLNKQPQTDNCRNEIQLTQKNSELARAASIVLLEEVFQVCQFMLPPDGSSSDRSLTLEYKNGQRQTGGFNCAYSVQALNYERFFEALTQAIGSQITCLKEPFAL